MNDLLPAITNNVAAIVMAALFIWYLNKRDTANSLVLEKFAEKLDHFAEKLDTLANAINMLEVKVSKKKDKDEE